MTIINASSNPEEREMGGANGGMMSDESSSSTAQGVQVEVFEKRSETSNFDAGGLMNDGIHYIESGSSGYDSSIDCLAD